MGSLERGQTEIKEQLVRNEERNDQRHARIEEQLARNEERNDQRHACSEEQLARSEERNGQRHARSEERNDQQFREVNRRIDRLWYTIVGIGVAVIVGYVLQQVFGG